MVPRILKSPAAIAAAFTMSLTFTSMAQNPAAQNACRTCRLTLASKPP